jgi:hypothetical protein
MILKKFVLKGKSVDFIKKAFDNKNDNFIDEYFDFLEEKEYGFFSENFLELPKINITEYIEPKLITNAIIDFCSSSNHNLESIIPQLSDCLCEAVELRFFYLIYTDDLSKKLINFANSTIRDIEVLLKYDTVYSIDTILKIRLQNARLRKITFWNSPFNKILEHEELVIIYTSKIIT